MTAASAQWLLVGLLVAAGAAVGAVASRSLPVEAAADRRRRRLVSDVAHELRSPLQNVRGTLEAAQDGLLELTPERIASLREEALLMQRLLHDLQELEAGSSLLAVRPVPTALGELLEGVAATYRDQADRRGVALAAEAPPGLRASVDPDRMRQVVSNLVENALRHTGRGDRIELAASSSPAGTRIEVRDTGEGIPPEHLDHVFDRLYRPDETSGRGPGGTGLGLAIARELVHAHDGELDVRSEPGVGTTFVVRLQ